MEVGQDRVCSVHDSGGHIAVHLWPPGHCEGFDSISAAYTELKLGLSGHVPICISTIISFSA